MKITYLCYKDALQMLEPGTPAANEGQVYFICFRKSTAVITVCYEMNKTIQICFITYLLYFQYLIFIYSNLE